MIAKELSPRPPTGPQDRRYWSQKRHTADHPSSPTITSPAGTITRSHPQPRGDHHDGPTPRCDPLPRINIPPKHFAEKLLRGGVSARLEQKGHDGGVTTGTCRNCGGPTFYPGGGRPAPLCPKCRGDGPDYGADFKQARAYWATRVALGGVLCLNPRCVMESREIKPGDDWDLGHDDRGGIRGCEHSRCNRSAGARSGHARAGNDVPPGSWAPTVRWLGVQIEVPDVIVTRFAYRTDDWARQAERLERLGGAPDDELVDGLHYVIAQLLHADKADRRRYLNRFYKRRSRARQRQQSAA